MIIYDHRPPVVKDPLVKVAIVMAYAYANSDNRAKYASVFPAFPSATESLSQTEPGEQGAAPLQQLSGRKDPVERNINNADTAKNQNDDPRLDYRFTSS